MEEGQEEQKKEGKEEKKDKKQSVQSFKYEIERTKSRCITNMYSHEQIKPLYFPILLQIWYHSTNSR